MPLSELITLNDKNAVNLGLSNILEGAPVLAQLTAIAASNGTKHKYVRKTANPSAASRAIDVGISRTRGAHEIISVDLSFYDADCKVDIAEAKGFGQGADQYISLLLPDHVSALFTKVEVDFLGLMKSFVDSSMLVDATGTGSNNSTSVYAVRSNAGEVAVVAGNDGRIDVGETVITETHNEYGTYSAYLTPIGGYMGGQFGSKYSVGRIKNITTATGKKVTDALLSKLLATAPAGRPFTHLIMNRQSIQQLQESRTATSPTGAPAPFPQDAFGVPIILTENIGNTEAVV